MARRAASRTLVCSTCATSRPPLRRFFWVHRHVAGVLANLPERNRRRRPSPSGAVQPDGRITERASLTQRPPRGASGSACHRHVSGINRRRVRRLFVCRHVLGLTLQMTSGNPVIGDCTLDTHHISAATARLGCSPARKTWIGSSMYVRPCWTTRAGFGSSWN